MIIFSVEGVTAAEIALVIMDVVIRSNDLISLQSQLLELLGDDMIDIIRDIVLHQKELLVSFEVRIF